MPTVLTPRIFQFSISTRIKQKCGRIIPMNSMLREALETLHETRGEAARPEWPVIYSERGLGMSAGGIKLWFHRLYSGLGMEGYSSHSGRRTFITRAARKVSEVGGSLRDVQQLAGHTNLNTTHRYVEGDSGTPSANSSDSFESSVK